MARSELLVYFTAQGKKLHAGQTLYWEEHREVFRMSGDFCSVDELSRLCRKVAKEIGVKVSTPQITDAVRGVRTVIVCTSNPRRLALEVSRALQSR